jgi:TrmH family RNA methyltransferase
MLSINQTKLISSLKYKKFRDKLGLFVAEGEKLVRDMSMHFECEILVANSEFIGSLNISARNTIEASEIEIKKISSQQTPQNVLAVFKKSRQREILPRDIEDQLILALDGIQNPGNFGTIIRIADWFGVSQIVCSPETVDMYNSKVVQATMGALANVNVNYIDLEYFIKEAKKKNICLYGTFLDGQNIYNQQLTANGIVVMGNESIGISPKIEHMIENKLLIPNFSTYPNKSESLNVSVATSVVLSEFRRRI